MSITDRPIVRYLCLAIGGYAVFGGCAFLGTAMLPDSFPTVNWTEGILVAVAFSGSEFLNTGRGKKQGLIRRVIVASSIMIVAILLTVWLAEEMGWRRTYELQRQSHTLMRAIVVVFFGLAMLGIRCTWARLGGNSGATQDKGQEVR